MENRLGNPKNTIGVIQKYEFAFQKKFGQNFLIDTHVLDKIIRAAGVTKEDMVLEIGPGIGTMTQCLAEAAGRVVAVEIDSNLIPILKDTLKDYDNITVINEDILKVDIKKLAEEYNGGRPIKVVANLPYYITTPILFKIFESNADIAAITVMMQKEVADRFHAKVNTKEYNALSIITQYRCDVRAVMKVPKNVFHPKPNVDSAVLQFTFRKHYANLKEESFFAMVKACFKQRRKTILNNFQEYCSDKETAKAYLEKADIDAKRRAESLTLDEFLHLYEVMQDDR